MSRFVPAIPDVGFPMVEIPNFPVRDLKMEAITRLAHEDWNLPTPKNANLEPVSLSFRANIALVRFLMLLPTSIAGQMALTQRVNDLAEYELTGELIRDELSLPPDVRAKIDARRLEMLEAHKDSTLARRGSSDWDKYVGEFHLGAAGALKGLTETPLGAYGFVEMLAAHVTGTWTAIESLLGDLWEAALNAHPKILAELDGEPRRIAKLASEKAGPISQKGRRDENDDRTVPLRLIRDHGFDMREKMGTVFRSQRRFEFTRLSSVREAYSRAFSEKPSRVDSALAKKSLDALSAVRNVLVHRAGRADAEYVRQSSYLTIPTTPLGEAVLLDGQIVADLITGSIASSKSLLIAVDDWLDAN